MLEKRTVYVITFFIQFINVHRVLDHLKNSFYFAEIMDGMFNLNQLVSEVI